MIYSIRNVVTNDRYIGQTIQLAKRWQSHLWMLRKENHHSTKLQRSFDKYGESSFVFEVLDESLGNENILEIQFIKKYDSFRNGLNMNEGGQSGKAYFKTWIGLIDPDGNKFPPIENLAEFCREHDLRDKQLRQVFSGDKYSHKGWTIVNQREKRTSARLSKNSPESNQRISASITKWWAERKETSIKRG